MKNKSQITRKKPSFSHDRFFKGFYSDPKLARELLQLIFSKEELKAYDLKNLKIEKDTFGEKRADLIVSVPFKTSPKIRLKIFILLEHKSSYDKNLFDQLLDYQILMRKHSIQQKGYPQPIIPVLFYHGKQPLKWKKSLQEEDFKTFFSKIPVESRKIMLNYGLKVIDTQDPKIRKAYKDKKLKGHGIIRLLSEIWSIKKIDPSKVKDIIVGFEDILKQLEEERKKDVILRIWEYLHDNTKLDIKTWQETEPLLIEAGLLTGGGVMDIREHIKEKGRWEGRKEGIKEGIKEGRKQVILNMLREKADISFISKITGLSEKEIKKLKTDS